MRHRDSDLSLGERQRGEEKKSLFGMVQIGVIPMCIGTGRLSKDAKGDWREARRADQHLAGGLSPRDRRPEGPKELSRGREPPELSRSPQEWNPGGVKEGDHVWARALSPLRGSVGLGAADRGLTPTAKFSAALRASSAPPKLSLSGTYCCPRRAVFEPRPLFSVSPQGTSLCLCVDTPDSPPAIWPATEH